jgi:integrase
MLDGVIARDPSVALKLPRAERGQVEPLSDEQVARLHDAAEDWFRIAIVLGAALGLRQSEASAVTVDRIDFLRRSLRVDRQWTRQCGFGPTKTAGSTRTVPVASPVLDLVARHVERYGVGEYGVLVHRDAAPMGHNPWQWEMRKARAVSGLTGVRYHDLRDHAASKLIAAGLSVVAVARFLGHDNPSTTLRTYAHLWGDDNDRIRSAMAEAWAPVSPACHEASEG